MLVSFAQRKNAVVSVLVVLLVAFGVMSCGPKKVSRDIPGELEAVAICLPQYRDLSVVGGSSRRITCRNGNGMVVAQGESVTVPTSTAIIQIEVSGPNAQGQTITNFKKFLPSSFGL